MTDRKRERELRRAERELGFLDGKTFNLLLRSSIMTRHELATAPDEELLEIRGFGPMALQNVRAEVPFKIPSSLDAWRLVRRQARRKREFERWKRREGFASQ